jgi:N-acetyltransferase
VAPGTRPDRTTPGALAARPQSYRVGAADGSPWPWTTITAVTAFTDLSPILSGRLVVLEPLRPDHEPGLGAAAADERVWRLMRTVASDPEAFHGWMDDALEAAQAGTEGPFCIVRRSDAAVVGSSRYLALRPEDRVLEIGHSWVAPAAWGTGVNTEAKLLLLTHAFEELGCLRVEFKTDATNERARAALAAIPATFEGVFRKHMLVRGGQRRDSAWYSVIDDDWPAVKAALEARVAASA